MANFESIGYCPCDNVQKALINVKDFRLIGLWALIGEKIVCINTSSFSTVNIDAVHEMFTTDPIAFRLMQRIINYNSNAEKISIFQDHTDGCINMQSFGTIQKKLSELENPELIVTAKSKFTVIIGRNKNLNEIVVYFWDLTSCM